MDFQYFMSLQAMENLKLAFPWNDEVFIFDL